MFSRSAFNVAVTATAASLLLTACGTQPAGDVAAATPSGTLTGRILVDGSSTVLPVSQELAAGFQKAHPGVQIAVAESGTGGGFTKLCNGSVDLIGASRPINSAEIQQCERGRLEYFELPLAFDSLSVVVNHANTFADCLTVDELRKMWQPAAQGTVTSWNQIRSSFPAQPLTLFAPGKLSGTFDYFTLAVVGTQSSSRGDATTSEDDTELVNRIAADPNALGYFGYAYYLANKDKLKLLAVDGGHGCVLPSPETVADATYVPLSRPLFVYSTKTALARPEVSSFVRAYLDPANAPQVRKVGYVPLPTAALLSVGRRLNTGVTGSIFGGRGSVLGLTADTFADDDNVKSALVR